MHTTLFHAGIGADNLFSFDVILSLLALGVAFTLFMIGEHLASEAWRFTVKSICVGFIHMTLILFIILQISGSFESLAFLQTQQFWVQFIVGLQCCRCVLSGLYC